MKIWIIDHYSVPEKYYPIIRNTNFAKQLIKRGHEVIIFSASSVHNSDVNLIEGRELFKHDIADGVRYVYVKCRNYKGNGIKRILNMEEFAYKLPKVCDVWEEREGKPDVILACSMTLQACKKGIQIARKYNAKAIAQITDLWPESLVSYGIAKAYNPAVLFLRKIEKWIYLNADKVVFSMEGAYDYIVERGWENKIPRAKVTYINNGVDLEQFNYNREHYKVNDDDLVDDSVFKVVYAGSIRKVNNLNLILDVAKQIKDREIKFLIWGDGDELSSLVQRSKEEKIDNVVFKGKVEKKYIPYILSCADLNIAHNSPSKLFRFGISFNKIFDYFAAQKPILTDFYCPNNPVTMCKAGIDVKNPNANEIADAICRIRKLDKSEYAKMCQGAKDGAEKYNFERLTDKLFEVFVEA